MQTVIEVQRYLATRSWVSTQLGIGLWNRTFLSRGHVMPPSHWTAANHSSDVRRWEACRNGGVSEAPWSLHRLILQLIATIRGTYSCTNYLLHGSSRICNTNTSNLKIPIFFHGASSPRLRSKGIVPLSAEKRQVDWTDAVAFHEICVKFQNATVSRTPPRPPNSLYGTTLSPCILKNCPKSVAKIHHVINMLDRHGI